MDRVARTSDCQSDPPVSNSILFPARASWIFILVSSLSIPHHGISRFNTVHCSTKPNVMNRNLLFPLSIFLLIIILPAIALFIPTSLPSHSDFSAIYNTDLALVHRVPIYELEQVEALAVQYAGIPPEKFFLARFPYPPWY